MITNLFKLETKRNLPVLMSFILIDLILSLMVMIDMDNFSNIQFIVSNVFWFLVPIYIFIDIYRYLYIGENYLIHMVPVKTFTIFLIKLIVFSLYLILLWCTNLTFQLFWHGGIYETRIIESKSIGECLGFFIIPRIISIFSGLIIIGAAISIGKLFKNIYISSASIIIVILSSTYGIFSLMKSNLITEGNVMSTIAINANEVFRQYAGLVTYYVVSNKEVVDIGESIYWNNLWINIIVGIIGLIVIYRITESKKYELWGK